MSAPNNPIVLAFSGGLDTSFCVPWLAETYGRPVVTATVNTGGLDSAALKAKSKALGAARETTAARRAGLATSYLGADVPVADWQAAVTARPTACVVLSIPTVGDAERAAAVVEAIHEIDPDQLVAVGGSAQDLAPEGCLRLGHRVGPAATLLGHALHRRLNPE